MVKAVKGVTIIKIFGNVEVDVVKIAGGYLSFGG